MYKIPIPVGASILCPENTKKSQPIFLTSIFICGAICAASTKRLILYFFAIFPIDSKSFIVPKVLFIPEMLISFVFSVISFSISSGVIIPISLNLANLIVRLANFASFAHGSKLLLCSRVVRIISSFFLKYFE